MFRHCFTSFSDSRAQNAERRKESCLNLILLCIKVSEDKAILFNYYLLNIHDFNFLIHNDTGKIISIYCQEGAFFRFVVLYSSLICVLLTIFIR